MTTFIPVTCTLADLLGHDYVASVVEAHAALTGEDLSALAAESVECYPAAMQARLQALLSQVGALVCASCAVSPAGAGTEKFTAATKTTMAPLNGYGYFRVGEDGRLYLIAKSEHYHAPLGHSFPGYRLVEIARRLGIPNATHNNTRGAITRRLEEELVAAAGLPETLNRVLNLETGSLAVEAALKMMLARVYQSQGDAPAPACAGRIPVVLVMGSDDGGIQGNYHGTTTLTQVLRGMWPGLADKLEAASILLVRAARPNCVEDLHHLFAEYARPPYTIIGAFHEIIMMNYGARLLSRDFLATLYRLCAAHEVPVCVDEIQSGIWHHDLFMFKEYGLRPDFVAVGKGFPGGEYPASRLLLNARYDVLPQFGALVTNGQEELASLTYLITMRWAAANAAVTRAVSERYQARMEELAAVYPDCVAGTEGARQMTALVFHDLPTATAFVQAMHARGFDLSAQTYKADCPPVVLTKLPLIADDAVVDCLIGHMADALSQGKQAPAR